jgi:hypothetical protein
MATISKYQTASGAMLYGVRYRTPDRGQTDKRGFKTKRDVEAFAAKVEVTKMRGEYVAPSLGRVTVGELEPAWLARQQGHMNRVVSGPMKVRGSTSSHDGARRRSPRSASPTCRRGLPSCRAS